MLYTPQLSSIYSTCLCWLEQMVVNILSCWKFMCKVEMRSRRTCLHNVLDNKVWKECVKVIRMLIWSTLHHHQSSQYLCFWVWPLRASMNQCDCYGDNIGSYLWLCLGWCHHVNTIRPWNYILVWTITKTKCQGDQSVFLCKMLWLLRCFRLRWKFWHLSLLWAQLIFFVCSFLNDSILR